MNLKKTPQPGSENRHAVLKVLLDKRSPDKKFHTFKEISARTKLNIREVMDVTGHDPYDIIGTRKGYKHISRATKKEVRDSIDYLESKIDAMATRISALAVHA